MDFATDQRRHTVTALRDGTGAVGGVSPEGDGLSGAVLGDFHACTASSSGLAWVLAVTEAELTGLQIGDLMSHNGTV
jgi:hypothetical protein